MKKIVLITFLILLPIATNAYDFEVNGLYYSVRSISDLTCSVDGANSTILNSNSLTIPSSVSYNSRSFSVIAVGREAFMNADFENISIPNGIKELDVSAFSGCRSLKAVQLPNSMERINTYCFKNCISLESISMNEGLVIIGTSCFESCKSLKKAVIPNSVIALGNSDSQTVFRYCSSLESVTIGAKVPKVRYLSFDGCENLKEFIINSNSDPLYTLILEGKTGSSLGQLTSPKGFFSLTNVEKVFIGRNIIVPPTQNYISHCSPFRDCHTITEIEIGEYVQDLASFSLCDNIISINSHAEIPPTNAQFDNKVYVNATLKVPHGKISTYSSASGWQNFFNIIENDDTPQHQKCANPTIKNINGQIIFDCETEGVTFISSVICEDNKNHDTAIVPLTAKYRISVYAKKDGYDDSDIVTKEISIRGLKGDVNEDGEVNIADINSTINIILSN